MMRSYVIHLTFHLANTLKVHLGCLKWQDFILLYRWIIFSCNLYATFYPSCINAHLGGLHILTIVNKAAIAEGCSFWICVFVFLGQAPAQKLPFMHTSTANRVNREQAICIEHPHRLFFYRVIKIWARLKFGDYSIMIHIRKFKLTNVVNYPRLKLAMTCMD